MTPEELRAAEYARKTAQYAALAEVDPEAGPQAIARALALIGAIRLRQSRDRARANCETATPLSHPDHEGRNVRPSAPVSGVGN